MRIIHALTPRLLAALVLIGAAAVRPAGAQEADADVHAVSVDEIDMALEERGDRADADRAAIRRVLQRNEVRRVAGALGIDLERAEAAAATLDGRELASTAALARSAEAALVGGDAITISTTALIIGLLILIVLLLA